MPELLKYAANAEVPARLRREALAAIEGWDDQNPIDTTTGLPRDNPGVRDAIDDVVKSEIATILETAESEVLIQSTRLALLYGYEVDREVLVAQLENRNNSSEVRVSALDALTERKDQALEAFALANLKDRQASLRSSALRALLVANPVKGVQEAINFSKSGAVVTRQDAIAMLGAQSDSMSGNYLRTQLQALIGGKGNPKTNLDIVEAARNRSDANIKKLVTEYDQSIATAEPMVKYAFSLQGGDVDRGEDVFMNHGAAQCVRVP